MPYGFFCHVQIRSKWMVSGFVDSKSVLSHLTKEFLTVFDVLQLTIGSEGFYGPGSKYEKSNPQEWGSQIGQDFAANHLPKSIDYMTIHFWPENWNRYNTSALSFFYCLANLQAASSPTSGQTHLADFLSWRKLFILSHQIILFPQSLKDTVKRVLLPTPAKLGREFGNNVKT